jgi:hypothetical protein
VGLKVLCRVSLQLAEITMVKSDLPVPEGRCGASHKKVAMAVAYHSVCTPTVRTNGHILPMPTYSVPWVVVEQGGEVDIFDPWFVPCKIPTKDPYRLDADSSMLARSRARGRGCVADSPELMAWRPLVKSRIWKRCPASGHQAVNEQTSASSWVSSNQAPRTG